MKAFYFLPAIVALAGCMETEQQPPNPAMVVLENACQSGDTSACAKVLDVQQRNQALRQQAAANYAANYKPYELKMTPMQPVQMAPVPVVIQPAYTVSPLRRNGY